MGRTATPSFMPLLLLPNKIFADTGEEARRNLEGMRRHEKEIRKPIIVCVNFPVSLTSETTAEGLANFQENGIATYPLPERAVRALKGLVRRGQILQRFE